MTDSFSRSLIIVMGLKYVRAPLKIVDRHK